MGWTEKQLLTENTAPYIEALGNALKLKYGGNGKNHSSTRS